MYAGLERLSQAPTPQSRLPWVIYPRFIDVVITSFKNVIALLIVFLSLLSRSIRASLIAGRLWQDNGTSNQRFEIGAAEANGPSAQLDELDFALKNPGAERARLEAQELSGLGHGEKLVLHR